MPTLEITTKIGCSNICSYCPQSKLIKAYQARSSETMMSLETFKTCIDKLPQNVIVEFSGMVEPWLNPNCTAMVQYAHNHGHVINVFSTLVGMNDHDVDQLAQLNFQNFWIHLPSAGDLEKFPITDHYLKIIKRVYKLIIKKQKDDSIKDISIHIRGTAPHPRVAKILGDIIEKRSLSTRANNIKIKNVKHPRRKRGQIGCRRGLSNNILLPNGDVVLCCMDYGLKHIIGNLLTSNYQSLFTSPEFQRVKQGLKNGSVDILCRYCDMFATNQDIRAKIYNSLNNIRHPKDFWHYTKVASKLLFKKITK